MGKESALKPTALLVARHLRINPKTSEYEEIGKREACGKVTTVFVELLVAALISGEVITAGAFKYHGSGTGTLVPEAAGDVDLETPIATIARVVGTQEEGATANIYKSIATITYDGDYEVTEHGLFDTDGTNGNGPAGGNLMDRTVFGAITVADTDQIEFTYRLTCPSGG